MGRVGGFANSVVTAFRFQTRACRSLLEGKSGIIPKLLGEAAYSHASVWNQSQGVTTRADRGVPPSSLLL